MGAVHHQMNVFEKFLFSQSNVIQFSVIWIEVGAHYLKFWKYLTEFDDLVAIKIRILEDIFMNRPFFIGVLWKR
jgi:hypothetical protein